MAIAVIIVVIVDSTLVQRTDGVRKIGVST